MALPSTNDFTGRVLRIVTPGAIPFGNFNVRGGVWTGGTAGQQASFVDSAGREYDFVFPTAGHLVIGPLGWISGPASITAMPSGEMLFYIGPA